MRDVVVLDKHDIHVVHTRISRTQVQIVASAVSRIHLQPLYMLRRACRLTRHRAVRLVAHPATQVQIMGLLKRALSEHDTLNRASD